MKMQNSIDPRNYILLERVCGRPSFRVRSVTSQPRGGRGARGARERRTAAPSVFGEPPLRIHGFMMRARVTPARTGNIATDACAEGCKAHTQC
ncbi:unnamed protein product [Plutella xylostella]|uniref:(diamondback moth) hypothetical protein n=1 Tax=Plutella xylostella TaxID=51655 RepID=A0A8S4E141_PLUXY|nr:unnamed protein product [Plutella xylostella]